MTKRMKRTWLGAALVAAAALSPAARPGVAGAAAAAAECQGEACAQVTLTEDGAGQKFTARNSSDRWVRVSASNLAAYAGVCLAPGREGALNLKSVTSYRADYAEPKCETPAGR
ncbi:MAG TPA: hypothetical protein VF668_11205 [Pyrinomonadaceae bacterium]